MQFQTAILALCDATLDLLGLIRAKWARAETKILTSLAELEGCHRRSARTESP